MNPDKLEALRRKYASAKGGDIHDPAFKAVAEAVFTSPDRR
jgi:agmatinase